MSWLDSVYIFLIANDVWIFFVAGLGVLWYLLQFVQAQRSLRNAFFDLEFERGRSVRNSAFGMLLLLGLVVGITYYANGTPKARLEPLLVRSSPTPDPFASFIGTPTPRATRIDFPTSTPYIAPTATLRELSSFIGSAENGTPAPPSTVTDQKTGCSDNIDISQPLPGELVSGGVSVFGSANDPNFGRYELDITGPQTAGVWVTMLSNSLNQPVTNSFLGGSDLAVWQTGSYQLRLTVRDVNDVILGRCAIVIELSS